MQIIRHTDHIDPKNLGAVIAIGNFDGIHLGHQSIINHTINLADQNNCKSAILTFEPHPAQILAKQSNFARIFTMHDKIELIEKSGVDLLFLINFDLDFAKLSAEQFIDEVLVNRLKVRHVVTGANFGFGHKRGGSDATLLDAARAGVFGYDALNPLEIDGNICSSSLIKSYLKEGLLAQVNQYLGHPYYITGKVIEGNQLGRTIGVPTANIKLQEVCTVKSGVYSCYAYINEIKFPAIANIGPKKNYEGNYLEVNIFDQKLDLYSQRLKVELLEFVRPMKEFAALDELKRQIENDIKLVRAKFSI